MAQHVWFFPFRTENCMDTNSKTQKKSMGLDGVGIDKKMVRVLTLDIVYDHDGPVQGRTFQQELAGLADETVLYIVGHCAAGSTTLSSVDETQEIYAAGLVGLLAHIPKQWPGRIKCYGCQTGLSGQWLFFWRTQPFAKLLFDAIRPTHPKLSVFGYSTSVPMSYNQPNMQPALFGSSETVHKHVSKDGTRASKFLEDMAKIQ